MLPLLLTSPKRSQGWASWGPQTVWGYKGAWTLERRMAWMLTSMGSEAQPNLLPARSPHLQTQAVGVRP